MTVFYKNCFRGYQRKGLCKLVCCILLTLILSACGKNGSNEMYLEEAQLAEEENKIVELLGMNQKQLIYDFQTDDTINAIQINTYELSDGQWILVTGGGGQAWTDPKGRIALEFERISDDLRVAIQSGQHSGATSYQRETEVESENMGCATSALTERKEIVYEQEIPVAIQIVTSQNEVHSYVVDYFFQPEEYEKYDYEHVYAMTVLFSQKTLNELSE